ncbi:MAG: hypothetical protein J7496_16215 [Novosphingobium sp.]|nr:hypothetical protein [Novosphingobium sp.]
MTDRLETARLIALVAWLVVMIASYSSYRLHWKKSVTMALIWLAIFIGVAGLVAMIQRFEGAGEAIGLSL